MDFYENTINEFTQIGGASVAHEELKKPWNIGISRLVWRREGFETALSLYSFILFYTPMSVIPRGWAVWTAEPLAITCVPQTRVSEKWWHIRGTRLRHFSLTDWRVFAYNIYDICKDHCFAYVIVLFERSERVAFPFCVIMEAMREVLRTVPELSPCR